MTASSTVTWLPSVITLPTRSSVVGAWVYLIQLQLSPEEVFLVQALDRRLGLSQVGHLEKTKSPELADLFLFKDYSRDYCKAYLTKNLKNPAKIIL